MGRQPTHQMTAAHTNLLRHKSYLWLKVAVVLAALVIAGYVFLHPEPRHNGGTWYGYTLGTISALLIAWLALLGVKKRSIKPGKWSIKGWTSAHVYLGLSLLILATLHTGFQFGLNIHTLAYALMVTVIVSGVFGIYYYSVVPKRMSINRGDLTGQGMLDAIAQADGELLQAALPLNDDDAELVQRAITKTRLDKSLTGRLQRKHPECATAKALEELVERRKEGVGSEEGYAEVIRIMEKKNALLLRARRHMRYRAILELWLYFHVPLTFALLAALTAHIFSVFYFW